MFDKIPSLKDFIIYVIPGILICYFTLNILSHFGNIQDIIGTSSISKNSVLTVIGIIFSFLVGFLSSQVQIIISNHFLYKRNIRLRTLKTSTLSEDLKDKIATQIITIFNFDPAKKDEILEDNQIFYLCVNYVKIYSNDKSVSSIQRSGNFTSFASALPIPVLLGLWDLFLIIKMPFCYIIPFLLVSLALLILLTRKIILGFREDWVNTNYRQFFILSLRNNVCS